MTEFDPLKPVERQWMVPNVDFSNDMISLRWKKDERVFHLRFSGIIEVARFELEPGMPKREYGEPIEWTKLESINELRENLEWTIPRQAAFS